MDKAWQCNDGGIYYFRETGVGTSWYGEGGLAQNGKPVFANVGFGLRDSRDRTKIHINSTRIKKKNIYNPTFALDILLFLKISIMRNIPFHLFVIFFSVCFFSCGVQEEQRDVATTTSDNKTEKPSDYNGSFLKENAIIPVSLHEGMNIIRLDDYFADPLKIDSIALESDKITHTFFLDEKRLQLDLEKGADWLTNIVLRAEGTEYHLPLSIESKVVPKISKKLTFQRQDEEGIHLGFDAQPTRVLAYLDHTIVPATISEKEIIVRLPESAKESAQSKLKVYSHDGEFYFTLLELQLKNGKNK